MRSKHPTHNSSFFILHSSFKKPPQTRRLFLQDKGTVPLSCHFLSFDARIKKRDRGTVPLSCQRNRPLVLHRLCLQLPCVARQLSVCRQLFAEQTTAKKTERNASPFFANFSVCDYRAVCGYYAVFLHSNRFRGLSLQSR